MSRFRCLLAALALACGDGPSDPPKDPTDRDPTEDTSDPAERDRDFDGSPDAVDCAPDDPAVFPGAPDDCGDDRVTDCDRTSDDGLVTIDGGRTYRTVQEALVDADGGSEIRVCAGTFYGPFTAPVPVRLVAHEGPERTTLDGQQSGSTLSVPGGTTIEGFAIVGGLGLVGGGVYQTSPGSLAIVGCEIRRNTAQSGGGVYVARYAAATIVDTVIAENHADAGGGIAVQEASVDLTGSVVEQNTAPSGGGVLLVGATMSGGQVIDNVATDAGGGGVQARGLAPEVVQIFGTEIAGNDSPGGGGGGLLVIDAEAVLADVDVHDNQAADGVGGGLYSTRSALVLAGTTRIHDNDAPVGGGAFVDDGSLTGGVFEANTGSTGGGIYAQVTELRDVTVQGNGGGTGGGLWLLGPTMMIGGSVLGNTAEDGAGAAIDDAVRLEGVTVADNVAGRDGGGLYVYGSAAVSGSTIVRNVAGRGGGAVLQADATTILASVSTDWGDGADDNAPDDVYVGAPLAGYGAAASFVCTSDPAACSPAP